MSVLIFSAVCLAILALGVYIWFLLYMKARSAMEALNREILRFSAGDCFQILEEGDVVPIIYNGYFRVIEARPGRLNRLGRVKEAPAFIAEDILYGLREDMLDIPRPLRSVFKLPPAHSTLTVRAGHAVDRRRIPVSFQYAKKLSDAEVKGILELKIRRNMRKGADMPPPSKADSDSDFDAARHRAALEELEAQRTYPKDAPVPAEELERLWAESRQARILR